MLHVPKSVVELRCHWCRITFKGLDKNIRKAMNVAFSSFDVGILMDLVQCTSLLNDATVLCRMLFISRGCGVWSVIRAKIKQCGSTSGCTFRVVERRGIKSSGCVFRLVERRGTKLSGCTIHLEERRVVQRVHNSCSGEAWYTRHCNRRTLHTTLFDQQ